MGIGIGARGGDHIEWDTLGRKRGLKASTERGIKSRGLYNRGALEKKKCFTKQNRKKWEKNSRTARKKNKANPRAQSDRF